MKTYYWLYLANEGLTIVRPVFVQVQADHIDAARKRAITALREQSFIGRAFVIAHVENERPLIIKGDVKLEPITIHVPDIE